jgi:glycosyltransferase involved in cell wall biosynthesis
MRKKWLKMLVVLAPLRFGAGLKGKLLQAMVCGTPSVTTNIGAEAMFGNFQWNGFIDDNPQDLPIQRLNYIRINIVRSTT